MRQNLLVITTLCFSLFFSSCKKDDDNNTQTNTPTPTPTDQLFIKFTLDSVAKNITSTTCSINGASSGGSSTTSGFFNLTDDIQISIAIPKDTILGSDLQSLIGQNLPFVNCLGCPTNCGMSYTINGDDYDAFDSNNPFPTNFLKITSVTFSKTVNQFGQNLNDYFVTGEFNAKLSYGTNIKSATGGTFRLVFREVKG